MKAICVGCHRPRGPHGCRCTRRLFEELKSVLPGHLVSIDLPPLIFVSTYPKPKPKRRNRDGH